jgi:hypothetical protein
MEGQVKLNVLYVSLHRLVIGEELEQVTPSTLREHRQSHQFGDPVQRT